METSTLIMNHLKDTFRYVGEKSGLHIETLGEFITITSSFSGLGTNYILGSGIPSAYEALINPLKDKDLSFVWFSSPLKKDLTENLKAYSLTEVGPLTGLALDLQKQTTPFSMLHLEIIPVTTPNLFQKWRDIHTITWNKDPKATNLFFRGLASGSRCSLILAKLGDHFVGCSLLDIQGDIAGCYWDCVLPEYRKQGIGTAMIHARIQEAYRKGCKTIIAQCLNSSLPLYLKSGFKKYSDMALFRFDGKL